MTEDVFGQYGDYYDLLYRDKDYAAETEYVIRRLREMKPDLRSILEFGSGTGRHGRLLARAGLDVLGIERSRAMLTAAACVAGDGSAMAGRLEFMQGDLRTANAGRTFDAVLALFDVMSYQTTNDDLLQGFRNAARHLPVGGLFLFEVWHGPAVLSDRPSGRVKQVEAEGTVIWRVAQPQIDVDASVIKVRYTILATSKSDGRLTTFEEEHSMRYLFRTEVESLAEQSGFDVEWAEQAVTRNQPSERTWSVCYCLRKQQ